MPAFKWFKSGLLESLKEFRIQEFVAEGSKINSDDILITFFIVSSKLQNPQFAGQTKED